MTVAFLVLVFLLGGGARDDILSLVVLRPVAVVVCVLAALGLSGTDLRPFRFVLAMAAALVGVAVLHVLPLPPQVWHLLPGRELLVAIDAAAGLDDVWRPLALVPASAWNALFSLSVPLAALALAIPLRTEDHLRVARWFVIIGLGSAVLGVAQLAGGPEGPLYFYRITNSGALVGLFSNRNHHAIYLATLLPILACLASLPVSERGRLQLRYALIVSGALFLIAALVVTGSRAGFVVGLGGGLAALILFRRPQVQRRSHRDRPQHASGWTRLSFRAIGAGLIAAIAAAFLTFSELPIVARLFETGGSDELRFKVWQPILEMGWTYFPFGSGNGSFAEVYKIGEPTALLHFNYLNHAHNDLLEIFLTMGLVGLVLAALAAVAWAIATLAVFRRRGEPSPATRLAQLGACVVALLALASVADYPLRTPSLACFFVFAVVWLAHGYAGPESGKSEK